MMRIAWLLGALVAAFALAVWACQSPAPVPASAPDTAFSAARAMVDVREIARRPHAVGSADHARVEAWLTGRMAALGLSPEVQTGPLAPESVKRLERWELPSGPEIVARNIVGIQPGRDPALPAVLVMAHYDSTAKSPGAADDGAGVAAVLEAVRALKARGPLDRDLIVLMTDGEELGLDGARVFFSDHPWRERVGAVVNLEARGGGGRAMMFETGKGNAETIALFARAAPHVTGGVTSNALAVFVYELMPNGTDFTVNKDRGVGGLNFAFIGRPDQYHAAASTPEALDAGSVQHIGSQALESLDALTHARVLPQAGADAVYADLFGVMILSHSPVVGWLLLALALGLAGFAGWRARRFAGLELQDIGRGAVDGVWFLTSGFVLTHAVRQLAGQVVSRPQAPTTYYDLLERMPWMEGATALTVLALVLMLMAGRGRLDRWIMAGLMAVATVAVAVFEGVNVIILGAGVAATALSFFPGLASRSTWGGWLGLIALILGLGLGAQALAPTTAFLFLWPALLAAAVAAAGAWFDPGLTQTRSLAPAAVAAALGVGWLMSLAHPVFLGIGMDLPGVLALLALVGLIFIRPLSPESRMARPLMIAAGVVLLAAAGLSGYAQYAEPPEAH
ncbi:MAG: M20/M25/M40 family metallo-hydrolase [Pseudomonadota bacterium]